MSERFITIVAMGMCMVALLYIFESGKYKVMYESSHKDLKQCEQILVTRDILTNID